MLQRVAQIAAFGANPVNAFTVRIRFGRRFVRGSFANSIDLLDGHPFVLLLVLVLGAMPAHLLRDLRLGFVGIAVFIQQFRVFVRACVGLLQELLVIVLVPFLFVGFLTALML